MLREKKRQKVARAVQRGKVHENTVSSASADVWLIICCNVFHSPHTVFRLMMACKAVNTGLKGNKEWWAQFYARIVQYQQCLSHSNFLSALREFEARANKQDAIRLAYSPRCGFCGIRFGHSIFRPFMQRVCAGCLSGQLVSNRVLYTRYGLNFSDFIVTYCQAGGLLLHKDSYRSRSRALHMRLTREPVDHVSVDPLLFMRRADVERVLGCTLESERYVQQRQRIDAARLLSAAVARSVTRRALARASTRYYNATLADDLRTADLMRVVEPAAPRPGWFPGGPFYAFRGPRGEWVVRRGITLAHVEQINRMAARGRPVSF